jgi:hypothetical protein
VTDRRGNDLKTRSAGTTARASPRSAPISAATVLQLVAAATVPVLAAADAIAWVTARTAGVVLILEGIQQMGNSSRVDHVSIDMRGT